jgi:hypothetical protein
MIRESCALREQHRPFSLEPASAGVKSRETIATDELLAHIIRAIRQDESITLHWDRSVGRFVVESS